MNLSVFNIYANQDIIMAGRLYGMSLVIYQVKSYINAFLVDNVPLLHLKWENQTNNNNTQTINRV